MMNLITDEWRLKLLAVGLAVLMLGAVAFSQNPPTTSSLTIGLNYSVASNLVLINPPSKVNVTYSGLADVIKNVNASNLVATVDATHASPGAAVQLNITVTPTIRDVKIPQQPAPIVVRIDDRQSSEVQVTVVAQAAPGWSIEAGKTYATCPGVQKPKPCTVHFDGPATWQQGLAAYVSYPSSVNVGLIDAPNYSILLKNSGGILDLSSIPTIPQAGLDVTAAAVHIEAVAGSTSSTVPLLDSPPSHGPPPGYRVTAITITPILVSISGEPVALGRIHNITLPPVDLSGNTSDFTFQIPIRYPEGITGSPAIARVTYSISPNPSVSPNPSPTP